MIRALGSEEPWVRIGCTRMRALGAAPIRLSQKSWPLAEIRVAVGNPCLLRAPPEGGLKPASRHQQSRTGSERCVARGLRPAPSTAPASRRAPRRKLLASAAQARLVNSNFTPGPMVEDRLTRLMKAPLIPVGRWREIAPTKAFTFAAIASSVKLAFPTPAWM